MQYCLSIYSLSCKICYQIYKGKENTDRTLVYIGDKVSSASVGLELAMNEMLRMAKIVQKMITRTKK